MPVVMWDMHEVGFEVIGKSLILHPSQLLAATAVTLTMFNVLSLLSQMRNWNRPALTRRHASRNNAPSQGLAHELLSSAEARAGHDPRQAAELRRNARAYLSVVR